MRTIKERDILSIAPNASAVNNAKKISSGSQFVRRLRSEDDSFYMGECKGSGKSNYIVSADYIEEENPVFRCSCPSRQLPCKHSIALLYEMLNQKEFEVTDIPWEYYNKSRIPDKDMHKDTRALLEKLLIMNKDKGEKYMLAYMRWLLKHPDVYEAN